MNKSFFKAMVAVTCMVSSMSIVQAAAAEPAAVAQLGDLQRAAYGANTSQQLVDIIRRHNFESDDIALSSRNLNRAAALVLGGAATTLIARLASEEVKNQADEEARIIAYNTAVGRLREPIITAFRENAKLAVHQDWFTAYLAHDKQGTTISFAASLMEAGKAIVTGITNICDSAARFATEKLAAARAGMERIIAAIMGYPYVSADVTVLGNV